MTKYAIGVDFGTESGRAVLVDVADGRQLATSVTPYRSGVIDERLPAPDQDVVLPPDWALQDADDYLDVLKTAVPAVIREAAVDPADIIGIGVDVTACTMLPATADGTALSMLPAFRSNPHAWVKLWKHHAAQPEADRINEVARATGQDWLDRYGGKISSEWFFAKALQILDEAPEVYAAADRLLEATDWIVWQLTGVETRNACTAGYKAMWSKRDGFPDGGLLRRPRPGLRRCRRHEDAPGPAPGRRAGRRALGRGRGLDGPAARDRGRGGQCRRPRGRAGRDGHRARHDGHDHGHLHVPHGPRARTSGRCPGCAAASRTGSSPV